jgi:hypothetical protein
MSKYNNVNPGQYKVGGRERPDDLARERLKASQSDIARTKRKKPLSRKPKAAKRG